MKPATAPKNLSPEAQRIWARLHDEYTLTDAGAVQVLDAGLRAFDTARTAEATLRAEGLTQTDRYGGSRAHPCVDIARQARAQWLVALRLLGLHAEAGDEK